MLKGESENPSPRTKALFSRRAPVDVTRVPGRSPQGGGRETLKEGNTDWAGREQN